MKRTKKVVAALLSGTLAFSSVVAAPVMAFADEAATQDAGEQVYLNIVNGAVDNVVDADGNPVIESQAIRPVNNRFNTRGYNGINDRSVGWEKNAWKASTNFYGPTTAWAYGYGPSDYYYYNGNLTYPRYAYDYSPYNGRVSYDTYRQYAIEAVRNVQNSAGYSKLSVTDQAKIADSLAIIRSSTSVTVIDAELDNIRALLVGTGITLNTNWYLPYDYDYRWNWRNYDYRWDWRPYERDRKQTSSSTSESATKKVAVYRYSKSGDHKFSNDNKGIEGWTFDGQAFSALEKSNKPVYQYHNTETGAHYYTTDKNDAVVTGGKWEQDSVAFYANNNDTGKAVHRLEKNGKYLFTSATDEINDCKNNGWNDLSVAFYVAK